MGEVCHLHRACHFDHPRSQRRALHKWREISVYHRCLPSPKTHRPSPMIVDWRVINPFASSSSGMLGGVAWLAYFTSSMVEMTRQSNSLLEASRLRISQVNKSRPPSLSNRHSRHTLKYILVKYVILFYRSQVSAFMKNAQLPRDVHHRAVKHLEHCLLTRRMPLSGEDSTPVQAQVLFVQTYLL